MKHHYEDIRTRITEEPKWWDENGTPRYCEFSPDATADMYARECALVLIACQQCARRFKVCISTDGFGYAFMTKAKSIADSIRDKSLHYGDPPNVGCCGAGATMNCDDIRVIEYWHRDKVFNWVRDSSLEANLDETLSR